MLRSLRNEINITQENIAHHSFIILIWKKDLVQLCLKWVLGLCGRAKQLEHDSEIRHSERHLDMIKKHFTATKHGRGGISKIRSKICSYTKELIPYWCEEWLIFWWPHVGLTTTRNPKRVLFSIYLYIYIFFLFVKVNVTNNSGLIPTFWSQLLWGQGGNNCFS